jgi:hypothetical protein
MHLLDDHTLINIIVQVTDHPEATTEDAELARIATDIGAHRLGYNALLEAIEQARLARQPDHPFYGIAVYEINYRVEVDADPRWWPAGTWAHFCRELAGFADEVDTEGEPQRFWFNTSDGDIDAIGRLNDVIQAWQTALARREEPLEPDCDDDDGSEP